MDVKMERESEMIDVLHQAVADYLGIVASEG